MPHDGEPAPCESAASSRFATSGCSPDTSLSVLYGTSPGSLGSGSHPYLLGTSPPSSGHGEGKRLPAKKFWSRILYDPSLEAFEFKVGYIETVKTEQRKSGKEAWSERQHEQAIEVSVEEFKSRFPSKKIPFHAVVYFKQDGVVVWEAPKKMSKDSNKPEANKGDGNLEVEMSELSLGTLSLDGIEVSELTSEEHMLNATACVVPDLPEECWNIILASLGTRELCMLSRTSRWQRNLVMRPGIWANCHKSLFGKPADETWDVATIKRICRRSDLRAARWLEGAEAENMFDIGGSTSLKVDSSKVISAQGSAVRIWSHSNGRRISKLQGHSARVTCVAADDDWIVSGCAQNTVRVWGMDDLKAVRTLRGHQGPVTDVHLMNGMPLSSSEDGTICIWDPEQSSPVVSLETDSKVNAMAVDEMQGRLTSAGWSLDVWDIATAQRVLQLSSLFGGDDDDGGDELLFEMMEGPDRCGMSPYTALSQYQSILAAGSAGLISLWDLRTASRIAHLQLGEEQQVLGLQLDECKLLSAVRGSSKVHMYDIRALSSGLLLDTSWPSPVKTFQAASDVQCFQFHGETLVAGASAATHVWTLGSAARAERWSGDKEEQPCLRNPKEKKKKIPKRNSRFPKRTTR